ncbi:MAG: type II toxin-antitoxin system prevent-host-death family antitoxin [Pseudolysinimonas sp.]
MAKLKIVTVRDLRNRSADVLAEVARGETFVVTRDGEPIAELSPLPRRGLSREELIERRKHLPAIDVVEFRRDIDSILDQSL